MATMGNAFRITLANARVEAAERKGLFRHKPGDADIMMDYRAEVRYRSGAEFVTEAAAAGRITGAEVRHWAAWFRDHAGALKPARREEAGDTVARLWTQMAGQGAEFLLWPDAIGSLSLLALFTPDPDEPHRRLASETTVRPDDLQAFSAALIAEYEALAADMRGR